MRNRSARVQARRSRLWIFALVALTVGGGSVVAAQPSVEVMAEVRQELEGSFEALPLTDGWLLRPLEADAGFETIEVRGLELAIDGTAVSADEIRARLGALADPVIAFADLGADGQRSAFESVPEISQVSVEVEAEDSSVVARASTVERQVHRERRKVNRTDAQVVVGSSVTIEEDEVTRDVLVVGGSLTVLGLVKGEAVAIGGSVEVEGEVTGDVAAIGASVDLEENAVVGGDVVSVGGSVDRAPGAVIEGEIESVPFFPKLRFSAWGGDSGVKSWERPDVSVDFSPVHHVGDFIWELFGIAVLALFAALALLIARKPVERVGEQIADEPWKSGLVGLLSQILFFPLLVLVVLILVISIVGIPFLLLLPFVLLALVLIGLMGYAAVAFRLGRWSEQRFGWTFASPFLALLVGVVLIEIWSLLGDLLGMGPGPIKFFAVMFAIFGSLVCYVAWTVGFGGAVLSRFGSAPKWGGPGEAGWTGAVAGELDPAVPPQASEPFSPDVDGEGQDGWPLEGPPDGPSEGDGEPEPPEER